MGEAAPATPQRGPLPITVIGGYLGAGKTTLLNSLLGRTDRRIGVIVNDFGELGIDAGLVSSEGGAADVVNLPNGCVCCTLGDDLHATLRMLAELEPPLEHVVVEASGVADPAATAAWGTVPPFVPGGTIVLVACDTIRAQVRDRYVGGEVRRQIAGADLLVLTKADRCDRDGVARAERLVAELSSAVIVEASWGGLDPDLVLGPDARGRTGEPSDGPDDASRRRATGRASGDAPDRGPEHGTEQYVRWSLVTDRPVAVDRLRDALGGLPDGLLRLKGTVEVSGERRHAVVNVVGRTVDVTVRDGARVGVRLEAIGVADVLDPRSLDVIGSRLGDGVGST